MKPDVLSPKERPQLNLNIFKNVRFLMVLAIIAVLSASCNPSNEEVSDNDEDLAGLPDDSGVPEYLIPVVEKRLGGSIYKIKRFVSTPSYSDYGVNRKFKEGDMREWFIKCYSNH